MPKQLASTRKAIELTCPQCENTFKIAPSLVRCKNTFCSKECSLDFRQAVVHNRTCKQCGTAFQTTEAKERRGEGLFCSTNCYHKSFGTPQERLLSRRVINPTTGCWEYSGTLDGSGYGQILVNGKLVLNHRLAAHWWKGFDLEDRHCICHKCDNPKCFNPEHLFVGDIADNNRDKRLKGRQPSVAGARNPSAKLNETQVREIRQQILDGKGFQSIADDFDVSPQLVRKIHKRQVWASLD